MNKSFRVACRSLMHQIGLGAVFEFVCRCRIRLLKMRAVIKTRRNYARVLTRIRAKDKSEKIRVLFILSEPTKWKCLLLYRAMQKGGVFDPIVALSNWNAQQLLGEDALERHFKDTEESLDRLNVAHIRTVKTHPIAASDLKEFAPDIVVFNEQWFPPQQQTAQSISETALTCFIPYYVPDYCNFEIDCGQEVERFSHTYFTLNEEWCELYRPCFRKWDSVASLVPAGHPALDFFAASEAVSNAEEYVIYAPHFAFPSNSHSMKLILVHGTFDWSGKAILKYAQAHPEMNWVFKPHPLLRRELVLTGLMSGEEVDEYYDAWERIGTVCTSGDYQDIFLRSKAMITDCGSFLAEYGSTGKPLIHLLCEQNTAVPPRPSKMLWDTFYKVRNVEEMTRTFCCVLERGEDPNREDRQRVLTELKLSGGNASNRIVDYLRKTVGR